MSVKDVYVTETIWQLKEDMSYPKIIKKQLLEESKLEPYKLL